VCRLEAERAKAEEKRQKVLKKERERQEHEMPRQQRKRPVGRRQPNGRLCGFSEQNLPRILVNAAVNHFSNTWHFDPWYF
jgi:hypothetical protein